MNGKGDRDRTKNFAAKYATYDRMEENEKMNAEIMKDTEVRQCNCDVPCVFCCSVIKEGFDCYKYDCELFCCPMCVTKYVARRAEKDFSTNDEQLQDEAGMEEAIYKLLEEVEATAMLHPRVISVGPIFRGGQVVQGDSTKLMELNDWVAMYRVNKLGEKPQDNPYVYMQHLREALELVLMFYQPYTREENDRWGAITGQYEMTSKAMCDHIRKVLG